jgi:outer membrane protein TolC
MRQLVILSLAAGLGSPFLAAETRQISLRQAVDLALKQNPDLLIARFDEMKAAYDVETARDPFRPKLTAGSGLAYTQGFPLSIEGSAPSVIRVDASQTLWSRQRGFELAKSREDARGAGIDLQARREEAVLKVAQAYLEAQRLRRAAEVATRQIESMERLAEITRIRVAEGRELELENKRAAARLAQARYRARSLSDNLSHQEEMLALLVGLPPGDRVETSTEDRTPPALPAAEGEAVDQALSSSKELARLQSKLQSAGLAGKAGAAARLPQVDLVGQYGLFARFNNFEDYFRTFTRNNWQLGASIRIPLLAGPAARARAAQADTEAARLRLEIQHRRNSLALSVRKTYQDLRNLEAFREVARLDFEAAGEQSSVLMAQYEEGRAGLRQVEDARFLEQERWVAYLDAQSAVEKQRLAILKETGGLLTALQGAGQP